MIVKNTANKSRVNRIINKEVIIYGTGTIARKVYEVLKKENHIIKYFLNVSNDFKSEVDDFAEIKLLNDNQIISSEIKDTTVIIAIFNREVNIQDIIKTLKSRGYKNIITFCDFIEIYNEDYGNIFYLNSKNDFIKDIHKIKEIKYVFCDKKSKKIYDSIVKFRITKNYYDLVEKDLTELQYFPNDINNYYNKEKIRFIDCGAYDGDTIQALCSKFGFIEAIAAFEPDFDNYNKMLCDFNNDNIYKNIGELIALPTGIYRNCRQMKFNMNKLEASNICESGTTMIQCVSIDESIKNFKPTHIKMDIEGSEYDGLLGAKETIAKERPNLAISLYHKPEDLYIIPWLINSWNLNYKFYLRLYGYSGFELVLYAVAD